MDIRNILHVFVDTERDCASMTESLVSFERVSHSNDSIFSEGLCDDSDRFQDQFHETVCERFSSH